MSWNFFWWRRLLSRFWSPPSIHKTLLQHLYNVGPASKTLGRHCTYVLQMFSGHAQALTKMSKRCFFAPSCKGGGGGWRVCHLAGIQTIIKRSKERNDNYHLELDKLLENEKYLLDGAHVCRMQMGEPQCHQTSLVNRPTLFRRRVQVDLRVFPQIQASGSVG